MHTFNYFWRRTSSCPACTTYSILFFRGLRIYTHWHSLLYLVDYYARRLAFSLIKSQIETSSHIKSFIHDEKMNSAIAENISAKMCTSDTTYIQYRCKDNKDIELESIILRSKKQRKLKNKTTYEILAKNLK